ncbi:MAG: hypothetical protein AAF417_21030 [Pseudomonadota bacterium]
MDWMQIGSAILIIMMIVFIWPRARHMLKNSPQGSSQEWLTTAGLLGAVGLFVALLIAMV